MSERVQLNMSGVTHKATLDNVCPGDIVLVKDDLFLAINRSDDTYLLKSLRDESTCHICNIDSLRIVKKIKADRQ
tara:strand:+ start:1567 stop:1791 length:225 start_codon:yes stop_codon:yes gene_type:complete